MKVLRRLRLDIQNHSGFHLTKYQQEASDKILLTHIEGGGEVCMLWARRSGKTECLTHTGLTLGVYEILFRRRNFRLGLVNPAKGNQSIMVSRDRLRTHILTLTPWLRTLGITPRLGRGRKTNELILHQKSKNTEFRIQAISADPSAEEKGAGFQLMFLEQVENMDEQTMKTVIFPMAAGSELTLTKVLAGTPDLAIENNYFYEKSLALKYPSLIDWKTAGAEREDYQRFVLGELANLGGNSEAFRTQYACEWIQLRNRLIDGDALRILANNYEPNPKKLRGAGIDVAKTVDSTVVTVGERNGFDTQFIRWLELHGINYETQADEVTDFLEANKVKLAVVDAAGVGSPFIDMLRKRWKRQVIEFNSTSQNNSDNWARYKRELDGGRAHFPLSFPVDSDENRQQGIFLARFIEQHRDAIREVTEKGMIQVHAPEKVDFHDDYVTSGAFCVNACARPDPAGLFTSAAAKREQ